MTLLRAAFECQDGTVTIVVLCTGCYQEMLARDPSKKHWHSNLIGQSRCFFCEQELRSSALR